jgi:DNA invertase Pin-like site-specific DNA recombinase
MSHAAAIHPHHLRRMALVYVRQSTAKQLLRHPESTRRQYQLAERAAALGWAGPRIQVIDDDLGQSGAHSTGREGFQRLVAAISLGEVGLVLVTEVSRLSRLNSDWQRVLELCAVFETLLADDDGLYDPRDPNDRLVLGLKGTLFAAELHILRARMRGGLLNKARRGALALRLPVGYRRLRDGTVVLEPEAQVRATLQTLFAQFVQLKAARAVQRYFLEHGLAMPRYVQTGPEAGQLVWGRPTYQMIHQVLTNPVYAGLFVYGRRIQQVQPSADPSAPPRLCVHRRLEEEWEIVVPAIYPAYITDAQYRANRQTLRDNLYNFAQCRPGGRGAPREGPALLQGRLVCGRCGRRMTVSYGSDYAAYVCRHAQSTYATAQCQAFPRLHLDWAIRDLFFAAIQPARLETLLVALDRLEDERQANERQWQLRLERARYAARLAQRPYDAVDPDHRLVACELERRWDEALRALQELERAYAAAQRTALAPLTAAEQAAVRQLATDLPTLWEAPSTTTADRKRLLRLVIQDVTLTANAATEQPRRAELTIAWSGGVTTTHTLTCPPRGWHCTTNADLLEQIRTRAQHQPDHQLARTLNGAGLLTATGKRWTAQRVASIRAQHAIPTACPVDPTAVEQRGAGLLPVRVAARRLGVSPALVHVWVQHGVLASDQSRTGSYRWVRLTDADVARVSGTTPCAHLPRLREVMRQRQCTGEAVWELVRQGQYRAYRCRLGQSWEWRLEACMPPSRAPAQRGGPPLVRMACASAVPALQ